MDQVLGERVGNTHYVYKTDHKSEKKFCVEFSVRGRGHFPFDMLRYDMCHPVDSSDAAAMFFDYSQASLEEHKQIRTVKLRTWTGNLYWNPTYDRWRSFGWMVTTEILEG